MRGRSTIRSRSRSRCCSRSSCISQEMTWAAPLVGRAFIELGDTRRGLRVLEEGLAAHTVTRSALLRPFYLVLLAGALLRAGLFARAQSALDEATRVADATGQQAFAAEHARLQAEVLSVTGDFDRAEESYRNALTVSRMQGARWLELRAARGYAS